MCADAHVKNRTRSNHSHSPEAGVKVNNGGRMMGAHTHTRTVSSREENGVKATVEHGGEIKVQHGSNENVVGQKSLQKM